jgi:hypothetical protein
MFTETPDLSLARAEIAQWLGTSQPPAPPSDEAHLEAAVPTAQLLEDFVARVASSGFQLHIFPQRSMGTCLYCAYWELRRETFFGFHFASEAENDAYARLLACTWLLRDEWSRPWLG